jgi:3-hydroxyacyl-CoA dehydrogenase/enoyl-CoA hydratase/3-hydroxybutyryl-CoA epimerase
METTVKEITEVKEGEMAEETAFQLVEKENGITHLVIDVPGEKVNVLSSGVMQQLDALLDDLATRNRIKALIIVSGKEENFIAGADVSEIRDIVDPVEGAEKARAGQRIFQKINDLPFPVIAAIQGTCLGGGLELALACDFRVAKIHPKTRLGLPEVKLGIIPGFGGTQRLPRLIGLQRALGLILTGKTVDARKAGRLGIVDKVLPAEQPATFLTAAAEEFAREVIPTVKRNSLQLRRKLSRFPASLLEGNPWGKNFILKTARRQTLRTTKGQYPAPMKAIDAIQRGAAVSLQKGLEIEAEYLGELVATDVCKNLISVFYLTEAIRKDCGAEKSKKEPRAVSQVGLLGAGVMGGGIAQLCAYNDLPVRMKDIKYEAVQLGISKAGEIFQQAVQKKRMRPQVMRKKMSLVSGTTDYSGFTAVDFVIEAVVENMEIKKAVFAEVEREVSDAAIIATNTSSLSITEIASLLKKPERALGFHFFNPVHRMPLVEIIRGDKTSDETTMTAVAFAKRLGKTPIVVKNSPGFLVNRILGPYINEAAKMLEEGAKIDEIDNAMIEFGMPMGPLNLLDEVGIDVGYKVASILQEAFSDRIVPSTVIERLNKDGRLGKKGGRGLYVYQGKQKVVDQAIYKLIHDIVDASQELPRELIQDRLYFIMLKEGLLCLEEEIVRHPRDVDAGMIFGTGFPPFRGGLIKQADNMGTASCVEQMNALRDKFGERFAPPQSLVDLARKDGTFY